MSLFNDDSHTIIPLAERMRPVSFEECEGQEHLIGPGTVLRNMVDTNTMSSMILWGPPGTGKTTLARIISTMIDVPFLPFSAITSGITEIKKVMARIEREMQDTGRNSILFVDENTSFQ